MGSRKGKLAFCLMAVKVEFFAMVTSFPISLALMTLQSQKVEQTRSAFAREQMAFIQVFRKSFMGSLWVFEHC